MDRNRKRPIRLFFRVNSQELDSILSKMTDAGMSNREEFIRQNLSKGYVLKLDTSDINALSVQISRYGNNLNQIAKRVNETNHIYKEDVMEISNQQEAILAALKDLYKSLSLIIDRR